MCFFFFTARLTFCSKTLKSGKQSEELRNGQKRVTENDSWIKTIASQTFLWIITFEVVLFKVILISNHFNHVWLSVAHKLGEDQQQSHLKSYSSAVCAFCLTLRRLIFVFAAIYSSDSMFAFAVLINVYFAQQQLH